MPYNLVYIVMDSCRYDAVVAASTPNIDRIGSVERRYSYASWTSPSHFVMLMGISHHTSPAGVFASEVYKDDFINWRRRLDIADLEFKSFVPHLSLPAKLKDLGYRTVGRVSLPVLNPATAFSAHFDDYRLMADHNDFGGMIDEMTFDSSTPTFHFFNLGETHYPYMLTKEDVPILHGVHGVFKHLDEDEGPEAEFFNREILDMLQKRQVLCVEHVDFLLGRLFDACPDNTHIIVTADHGELFGEGGYFGHGPIFHEKVFEVPFVEGMVPR